MPKVEINKDVFAFNLRVVEESKRHREDIISDISHQTKSKLYNRADHLSQAMVILYGFEGEEPNTVNPTIKDVADTVHIISRLEAELAVDERKIRTGLFPVNYTKRIKIVQAISIESETLTKQLTILRQTDEVLKNIQIPEQVTGKKVVNQ
jgi:hypothetical protein